MTTAAEPFRQPDNLFNTLEHWTWVGCYGGYYLTSDAMQSAGFEHGFFTRLWQNRGPDALAAYLSAGVSVHRPQQVHGNRVLNADEASASPWPEADGLVSNRGGQSLWVCGADCTPVLLADPTSGHVAACHAGPRFRSFSQAQRHGSSGDPSARSRAKQVSPRYSSCRP